jgi:hypothetical protein
MPPPWTGREQRAPAACLATCRYEGGGGVGRGEGVCWEGGGKDEEGR